MLQKAHVLTVPGDGFCPIYGKRHFRAVYLPDKETLGRAFDQIESFMRQSS